MEAIVVLTPLDEVTTAVVEPTEDAVLDATELVTVEDGAAEVEVEVAVETGAELDAVVEAPPEAAVAAQEQTAAALDSTMRPVTTPHAESTQP